MTYDHLIGTKGHSEIMVTENNVAHALSSGALSVFGTPFMIALMERTSRESIADLLGEGQSTVGTAVNIVHVSASPIGMKVWADTEVIGTKKRRITFSVKAYDENGLIGEGTHERCIVDNDPFMKKCYDKLEK